MIHVIGFPISIYYTDLILLDQIIRFMLVRRSKAYLYQKCPGFQGSGYVGYEQEISFYQECKRTSNRKL